MTQLIDELAKSNYKAPSEASGSSNWLKGEGVIELNKMSVIEAKLDALMNKMNNHERKIYSTNEVRIMEGVEQKKTYQGLAHEGPYQVEEAQYIQGNIGYNFKLNSNLPTDYTLALRNHENLFYGGGGQQGPRLVQNFQHNYAP